MFNNLVFKNLYDRFLNGKLAHAYLFNTNDIEKLQSDLDIFIKAILCESEYKSNCSNCNICNLIDKKNLPDLLYIEPDGMSIKKQQVLELKNKFLTKPLYVKYNIYIINHCDYLNSSSANSILKFLEEPEPNIIGFYITDNSEKVIPTIKSRCEVVNVLYDVSLDKQNDLSLINDMINYVLDKKEPVFIYKDLFADRDEIDRKELLDTFEEYVYEINKVLIHESDNSTILNILKKVSSKDLIELFSNAIKKIRANVNIEMFIIDFAIELRNLYE